MTAGKGPDESLMGLASFPSLGRMAARGNKLATLISMFAFAFSAVSFYETVLKQPKISVHVPPVLHYGRDGGGDTEVFAMPLTLTNEGAQSGTVLSIDLTVEPLKPVEGGVTSKAYYAAYFGEHPRESGGTNRAFAPVGLAGRSSFSDTIRFYPKGETRPFAIRGEGAYRLKLAVRTAAPREPNIVDRIFRRGDPAPITFERTLPWYSDQQLGMRRGVIAMHAADWQAATAEAGKRP